MAITHLLKIRTSIFILSTEKCNVTFGLKGDRNPNNKYVYKKELYKPCILIPVLSKYVEK